VIVVDASVWIDYFNGRSTPQTGALDAMLGERLVIVGDLTLTEVLSGFRRDEDFRTAAALFDSFGPRPMVGKEIAVAATRNYRRLRSLGVTVRKTIDLLIGTFCIANRLPLLHSDRDFDAMEEHLGLVVWQNGG
jgi:predicted nucleic acid-binding protein